MIAFALFKKEFKQNAVIFITPYLALIFIYILNQHSPDWLSPNLAELLSVSLPFAMAGTYGLQAFDLEENGRTKDFLLCKPLTVNQIIWIKYLSGILVLLLLTVLWIILLFPQNIVQPDLNNLSSFWLTTFLMMLIILYSSSFLTSLLVKGPIKLFAAIAIGCMTIVWASLVWRQFLTLIFFIHWERFQTVTLITTYALIAAIIWFILRIFTHCAFNIFRNISLKTDLRQIVRSISVIVILPLALSFINLSIRPAICSFDSLLNSFFNAEEWFISLEGSKQPSGNLLALSDYRGRLGITREYGKPKVVYVSNSIESEPLRNIVWSPDCKFIAFSDCHQIKMYSLATKETSDLTEGDIPLWSKDSKQFLIGKILTNEIKPTPLGKVNQQLLSLTIFNPVNGFYQSIGTLTTTGSSLGWDSIHNRLLTVDISGDLKLIHLSDGKIEHIKLPFQKKREVVFFSKILISNPNDGNNFYLMIYTFNTQTPKQLKKYNLRCYEFDSTAKKINFIAGLKDRSDKDIISSYHDQSLLVRQHDNGLYRKIKLPQITKY